MRHQIDYKLLFWITAVVMTIAIVYLGWRGRGCTGEAPQAVDSVAFNQDLHYIVRVDTVGFKRDTLCFGWELYYENKKVKTHKYPIRQWRDFRGMGWGWQDEISWEYVWTPILDSAWLDKKPPLLTPQETEELKRLVGGQKKEKR